MTIEFFTFVVTLFALLVAGLRSFVSESKRWKRGLAVVTGVIALIAAVTLLESGERSRAKDQRAGEIERNWIRMAASDVLGWQFELVVDRGLLRLREALPFLQKMKFEIEGTNADASSRFTQDFSTVFTIENISKSGLLGDPVVKLAKNEHGSEYPREVECVASGYGSRSILAGLPKTEADRRDAYVCSVRVSVILAQHGPDLTELLKGKRISLSIPVDAPKCAGPCRDVFVGVRAIVPPPDDIDEPLIEISPMILAHRPKNESAGLVTYSLPGDSALELAKSA